MKKMLNDKLIARELKQKPLMTAQELAKKHNCSVPAIYASIHRSLENGSLKMLPKESRAKALDAAIEKYDAEGWSAQRISKKLKISTTVVYDKRRIIRARKTEV